MSSTIGTNTVKEYINQIKLESIHLTKEEELGFIREYQRTGNKDARNKVVYNNLMFVIYICNTKKRLKNKYIDEMEIISAGNEGLIKSIDNFDINKSTDFRTFAGRYIDGFILRYIASLNTHGRGYAMTELRYRVFKAIETLGLNNVNIDNAHTIDIIYNEVYRNNNKINGRDLIKEDVVAALKMSSPRSLNEIVEMDGYSVEIEDTIEDAGSLNMFGKVEDNLFIDQLYDSLNDKEKEVITLHYIYGQSLASIGNKFNCTRANIHNIKNKALSKMREAGSCIGVSNA